MKRLGLILMAGLLLTLPTYAQEGTKRKLTIQYVQKLQTKSGGFAAAALKEDARAEPTLRATSSAVRALHYLGGKVPNHEACIQFVDRCFDPQSGGFRDTPDGKADVFTTAVGLMAVTQLDMKTDKYAEPAVKFLSENTTGFEDIRIAVAGLERLKIKSPKADAWLKEVRKMQKDDGGYGQARATASAVVTELRLGGELEDRERVREVLKQGQRKDGGFGKDDADASDLETTYRVMRAFMMLKAEPERVKDLLEFVERCRNEDQGYGIAPGQPSNISGTYFAAIVKHWLQKDQPEEKR